MSLYAKYHDDLSNAHPYRRFVSFTAFRDFILKGCSATQYGLHVVLFENISHLDQNIEKWSKLHIVDEHKSAPNIQPYLDLYYSQLWIMIEPSPSQIRRILSISVETENRGKTKDAEVDAVKKRLNEMEDKDVNSLWYSIGVGGLVSGLVFSARGV